MLLLKAAATSNKPKAGPQVWNLFADVGDNDFPIAPAPCMASNVIRFYIIPPIVHLLLSQGGEGDSSF